MKKGIDFDLHVLQYLDVKLSSWCCSMEATKADENRPNLLAVSLPSPTLACLRARPKSPLRWYYAPFSVPFDLNFWKLRFTHPKKMPVKKYPYAPTLVYFADKHLWHSRQRSRGAGVFSPSPQPKFSEGMQIPLTLWCWKTVLPMYLTSATSGRIFSALRQFKSYLRSTMKQDPPEHLPTDPLSQIDYGHNRQWRLQRG